MLSLLKEVMFSIILMKLSLAFSVPLWVLTILVTALDIL